MQRRSRRIAVVPATTAAGLLLLIGAGAPAALASTHKADGKSTYYFVSSTTGEALGLQVTQEPAASIITAGAVDDAEGYTALAFDSGGGSEAQAASVYPGDLVVQGPSLLCDEGILPVSCPKNIPSYPLLADATYPQTPSASSLPAPATVGKGTALTATTAGSTATASATEDDASTTTGATTALAGSPLALSIGSQSSTSSVKTTTDGVVTSVTSSAGAIKLGSLLDIGAVTSSDVQTLVAGKRVSDVAEIHVTGVTILGQQATIDSSGIHIAGDNGPALARKLVEKGISITPPAVTKNDTKSGARSDVTGLDITLSQPLNHIPYIANPLGNIPPFDQIPGLDLKGTYIATLQLGAVGAATGLERQNDIGLGGLGPLPVTSTPSATATSPSTSTASNPIVTSGTGPTTTVGSTPSQHAPTTSTPNSASTTRLTAFFDDWSIERFYLAMAITAMVIFIGWRVRVATRPSSWPMTEEKR